MPTVFARGQEGIGAESAWRGAHIIETGFIIQSGYKEMRFTRQELGLWGVTKAGDVAYSIEELALWGILYGLDTAYSLEEEGVLGNDSLHWLLLAFPYAPTLSNNLAIVDISEVYVDAGDSFTVGATPNNALGYVLNGWTLDGVDESADPSNPTQRTVPDQVANTFHIIKVRPLLGWAVTGDSSVTTPGYYAVSSGGSKGFTQNIGSPPVDHYHYDGEGHIIHTCYMHYQWILDGVSVGTNSASYSVPAQPNGTDDHAIGVGFVNHCDYS
jgi:hypothetical protein